MLKSLEGFSLNQMCFKSEQKCSEFSQVLFAAVNVQLETHFRSKLDLSEVRVRGQGQGLHKLLAGEAHKLLPLYVSKTITKVENVFLGRD